MPTTIRTTDGETLEVTEDYETVKMRWSRNKESLIELDTTAGERVLVSSAYIVRIGAAPGHGRAQF